MRECLNGMEVMERIEALSQIKIEIIEGKKEAQMIYSSHIMENLDKRKSFLYIDVGGGSTELSLFMDNRLLGSNSFNIGTIRMLDNKDRIEDWESMKNWIKSNTLNIRGIQAIGTGGNINKLFRLAMEKDGIPMPTSKLKALYQYLSSYSLKDRINILGLKQDRADVILPAAEIFLAVCRWANIKSIHVPKSGLVDGIIQELITKNLQEKDGLWV
jgi:exopolyphosphatase/guanosine-5'-triphosphate,3'-diphosphate pyrophosphatase